MNVLVINGSPKGSRSNTLRLTRAFLEGIAADECRERTVQKMDIHPCLGCFSCWNKTPGECCIQDDMAAVIEDLLWAEVVVWSFPLYYFSIPGGLKNLIDRQLPMVLPFMERDTVSGGHSSRYDMSEKRHVVISTCGFYTAEGNYDGVTSVFDHLCGKGNYSTIFCGQGELFRVKELNQRTEAYLKYIRRAGEEFRDGSITGDTRKKLDEPLYPRHVFEAMADASWGVEKNGEQSHESLTFTRQMAALYRVGAYPGKDIVLEMDYSDIGMRYQVILGKEGSTVLTEGFQVPTTTIETPYSVWQAIAAGELSGEEALAQQKYRVRGDFSVMLHWDKYFGSEDLPEEKTAQVQPPTNMNNLLIPWIIFWIAASVDAFYGAVVSIISAAFVALLYYRSQRTLYDSVTGVLVTVLSLALILGANAQVVVPLGYFAFGIMWSVSCFMKVPLTALYSMNEYGGQQALGNALFMKTNRILTGCWGVLYLLTPFWTYFLLGTSLGSWTGAINSVLPAIMGIFTAWFQKWYPAKIARG